MRPTRNDVCMQMARIMAYRGTCSRMSVGVVIAQNGRLLSTGYNGAPAGMTHCDHSCNCGTKDLEGNHASLCPADGACTVAVHGEANSIAYAARHGIRLDGSQLYTTLSPCVPCAQLIINAGIIEVHFDKLYRDQAGLNLLSDARVYLIDREGYVWQK